MKYIKIGLVLFALFLTGCATTPNEKIYGQFKRSESISVKEVSSYVQWNNEYSVTVKHSKIVQKISYESKNFDLRFVRNPSLKVPSWNDPVKGEKITMLGFPNYRKETPTIREGLEVGDVRTLEGEMFRGVKTKIVKGMSGGPVINDKNEIVGINIGYSQMTNPVTKEKYFISIYLPYEVIKDEWEKFQNSKI